MEMKTMMTKRRNTKTPAKSIGRGEEKTATIELKSKNREKAVPKTKEQQRNPVIGMIVTMMETMNEAELTALAELWADTIDSAK